MKKEQNSEHFFESTNESKPLGPVITIARDFGCFSSRIASLLADRMNLELKEDSKWRWLSNEILTETAQSLKVEPSQITHVFSAEERPYINEIIESLKSKKYIHDDHIKKAILGIVHKYAEQGNVIIVGRAGCAITQHIKPAIHIKLVAPTEWRVKKIQERLNLTPVSANIKVTEIDEHRRRFMSFYGGNRPDCDLYDDVYNRSRLSEDEIVENIIGLAKMKKMI